MSVTTCGFTVFCPDPEAAEMIRELFLKVLTEREDDFRELGIAVVVEEQADYGEQWDYTLREHEGEVFPKRNVTPE